MYGLYSDLPSHCSGGIRDEVVEAIVMVGQTKWLEESITFTTEYEA